MKTRVELHEYLCDILGSTNVYFQPPPNVKLRYPAIVYKLGNYKPTHANNEVYNLYKSYNVTVIDKDPDTQVPDKLAKERFATFDRYYISDNLNHYVFEVLLKH